MCVARGSSSEWCVLKKSEARRASELVAHFFEQEAEVSTFKAHHLFIT